MSYLTDEVEAARARNQIRLEHWEGISLQEARRRADECRRDVEMIQAMVNAAAAAQYWTWYWARFESFRSLN